MYAMAYAALGNAIIAVLERPAGIDNYGGFERFKLRVYVASRVKARR